MNALIVLGGEAPSCALLVRCAQAADFVIAADRGLAAFEAAGLVPDLIVGDMDSVPEGILQRYAHRADVRRLCPEKDDTDGGIALGEALARGAKHVVILGALGGRMDHALGNLMMLVRAHREGAFAEIRTERERIVRIDGSITLRGAKGRTVSLIPIGEAHGVTLSGMYYHSQEELSFDFTQAMGVSNVVTADTATITVRSGDLLLIEEFEP